MKQVCHISYYTHIVLMAHAQREWERKWGRGGWCRPRSSSCWERTKSLLPSKVISSHSKMTIIDSSPVTPAVVSLLNAEYSLRGSSA